MLAGVLPNCNEIPANDFAAAFPKTALVGINLDQSGPAGLLNCVQTGWVPGLLSQIVAAGRRFIVTVPFPGKGQLEAVDDGTHDAMYRMIASAIVAAAPKDSSEILVRLGHEFNLATNDNVALDKTGKPNALLCQRALLRLSALFIAEAPARMRIVFSPAILPDAQNVVDPTAVYPGNEFVHYIWPDFYMCYAFQHAPGKYLDGWFRTPFLKMRDWAVTKGKPFGLAETGADHDDFAADVTMWLADAKAAKGGCAAICWWNDWQEIDCRITGSVRPKLAAAYQAATS